MSKKNKALKQLLKSQMQSNAAAMAQGKDLPQHVPGPIYSQGTPQTAQPVADKQTSEFTLIRKDIRLSILLIILIIIALIAIYLIDHYDPFLLNLANKIFKVI